MRRKKIIENRTLKSAVAEFMAFKRAQKIRERTLHDYQKYINPFIEQSSNSMDIDVLKREHLEYFANIPATIADIQSLSLIFTCGCVKIPPLNAQSIKAVR